MKSGPHTAWSTFYQHFASSMSRALGSHCSAADSSVEVSDSSSWSTDRDVRLSVNVVDGVSGVRVGLSHLRDQ